MLTRAQEVGHMEDECIYALLFIWTHLNSCVILAKQTKNMTPIDINYLLELQYTYNTSLTK